MNGCLANCEVASLAAAHSLLQVIAVTLNSGAVAQSQFEPPRRDHEEGVALLAAIGLL